MREKYYLNVNKAMEVLIGLKNNDFLKDYSYYFNYHEGVKLINKDTSIYDIESDITNDLDYIDFGLTLGGTISIMINESTTSGLFSFTPKELELIAHIGHALENCVEEELEDD